jgi:F-type H+-transporting ATPase subunit c
MMTLKNRLFAAVAFLGALTTGLVAHAEEAAAATAHHDTGVGLIAIAISLGIGLAVFGGALGQSRAAAAALEGIARNPNASDKVFVPMILGLSFIESLVLFAWVLMFLLLGKIA